MPRSLSDPLLERLLRSFPPDRAYSQSDWADDAMPDPVGHFLTQLLAHYSRREARRLRRARSDWVNYDHPKMEKAVRTFFDAMEAHTQVPADEWEKTLRQATRHTTAHLVRPVYVLTNFVFGDREKPLRLSRIKRRMSFFGPYAYLRKAVHAFAQKKDIESFAANRFEQFLYHVDERVTAGFDADQWLKLLDPLFTVVRRATDRERVSIPFLVTFFAEKSADAIEKRLADYKQEGQKEIGPKALYRLIEEANAQPAPPDPDSSAQPTEPSSAPLEREPAQPSSPIDTPDESQSSDDEIWGVAGQARPAGSEGAQNLGQSSEEAVPLWKQFQKGTAAPSGDGSEQEARSDDRQQPLWAQYRRDRDERVSDVVSRDGEDDADERAEANEPAPSTSEQRPGTGATEPPSPDASNDLGALEREILGTTNPPHRAVYVRQLFNGDKTAYQQVLRRLRTADSWGEASQIIASDVFRAYKVNIYSDAAVHFTNAVESRFREQ